jgi:DUF4097 and DUF4098 domain-containing protein YvlB
MNPRVLSCAPLLLLVGLGGARAAPDPMTGGSGLERVEVHAAAGSVRVKLEKTQHVRLNGQERDAKRDGKVLVVRRALGDVELTVPAEVALELHVAAGDVGVEGPVRALKVSASAGAVTLKVGLAADAAVEVAAQAGDVAVEVQGDTAFALDARASRGAVRGEGTPGAKAKVKLRTTAGDITVTRAP